MPTASRSEPPSELHLTPGGEASFPIGGAGSAGYMWTWSIDGDAGAISVAIASDPPAPPAGEFRAGSAGHIVTVRGLREGRARLRLVLARPMKPNRGPLADFTIGITVG